MTTNLKLNIYILAGSLLLLASCGSLYNMFHERPENTDKYMEQFRQAAQERGVEISYPKRFQIRLVDYMSGTRVGYCYNDIPMKIDLDREFWTTADTTQQKILFFHELSHCMLNRKHYNEVLPNGEWKSLMRGSPIPENRDYVINFSGFREKYYLDELFDAETQEPQWALVKKNINNDLDLLAEEIFDNNIRNWTEIDEDGKYLKIKDSGYFIKNDEDDSTINTSMKFALNTSEDYQIRAELSLVLDSLNSAGGFYFGAAGNLEYFLIDKEYGLRFGNVGNFRPYTNISLPDSAGLSDISLTVERSGDLFYFYFNESMVYHNEAAVFRTDSLFVGFNLAPHSEMIVKQLQVYN